MTLNPATLRLVRPPAVAAAVVTKPCLSKRQARRTGNTDSERSGFNHALGPELSRCPLLSRLPAEVIQHIVARGKVTLYPIHTLVIRSGTQSPVVHFILSGRVNVYGSNHRGKEILLEICGSGDCLGEGELVEAFPSPVSAITVARARIFALPRGDFAEALDRYPQIAFDLIRHLATRARRLTELLTSLALDCVYERVVKTLNGLAVARNGANATARRITHREIAAMVGASREMVSRVLKDLSAGGYIGFGEGGIIIHKKLPTRW